MKRPVVGKKLYIILFVVLITMAVSIAVAAVPAKKPKDDLYKQVELFADALTIVRSDYVDEVDSKKLIYGAMRGMLDSLDDFSQFLDPDEYNEIQLETKGEFGGVGIEIGVRDGILTVIAPIADSPAEAAGIKAGDKIVKINGKITEDVQLGDAVKEMRGKPGTDITITIWREKEGRIFDVTIKRAMIIVHSIKRSTLLEGKIGYIKLVEFQENTSSDLDVALKKLEGEGMTSLILDLRNNPGGLLETAVDVSERFLPKDAVIVAIKSRDKEEGSTFKSSGQLAHLGYPLVVIVNEGSASASEIVAGAIQGNKRGTIIGTRTFGKASVQTVIPLKDGSALRLTTASYLTPGGKLIRGQGIAPDIVVENGIPTDKEDEIDIFERLEGKKINEGATPVKHRDRIIKKKARKDEAGEMEDESDAQLEAAINVIKKNMKTSKNDKT